MRRAGQLSVKAAPAAAPAEAALDLEVGWDLGQRRLAEHGLELLGYERGEVDGAFTPATRQAISAFQASLGNPRTGVLTEVERVQLATEAGRVAAELAEAAATRAEEAALTVAVEHNGEGATVVGGFGPDTIDVTSKAESGSTYSGQWRNGAEDGLGRGRLDDREWAGEFSSGTLVGYGVHRVNGSIRYAGEWDMDKDRKASKPNGYGTLFGDAQSSGGLWRDGKLERGAP
jgi:peptidoglycan hydrolase-like protein with peptidoglycan-binding domain